MAHQGKTTFTPEQAKAICISPLSDEDQAKKYGVSRATISRIRNGHTYVDETLPLRNIRTTALKIEKHNERIEKYLKKIARETELRDRLLRDSEDHPYVADQKEKAKKIADDLARYHALLGR